MKKSRLDYVTPLTELMKMETFDLLAGSGNAKTTGGVDEVEQEDTETPDDGNTNIHFNF
jgi:hypothetical protein